MFVEIPNWLKIKKVLPFSLLSFLLAIFVWYLAQQGRESVEISFFVPLVFQNLPTDMQITSEVPAVINVSGKITRRHSNEFNPTDIQALVDLTNVNPGTFQYVLTERNISAPKEVSIVRINPNHINLLVEEVIEKTLTIRPRYETQLKPGKIFEGIEVIPETVRVQGPKSVLEKIDTIFTQEIDLQNINRTADMIIQLDLPEPSLRFMDDDVENYIAHIRVASVPIKKRFDGVAIHLMNPTHISVTNPTQFNLYVEGPEELLNALDSSNFYGRIDLSKYEPGSHWVQPQAVLPSGITLLQQWPKISLWVKPQKLPTVEQNSNISNGASSKWKINSRLLKVKSL